MSDVFLIQLIYYIAATIMFALGMKFNFYFISGQKSFNECISSFLKWYNSYELSPEPDSKTNNFKLISNGCNLIIWFGIIGIVAISIYTKYFLPLPYTTKYYMN